MDLAKATVDPGAAQTSSLKSLTVFPKTGPSQGTRLRRRLSIRLLDPILVAFLRPPLRSLLRHLPRPPRLITGDLDSRRGAWPAPSTDTPQALRTVPGIWRDPLEEDRAFRQEPLRDWDKSHPIAAGWMFKRNAGVLLPIMPTYLRAGDKVAARNRSGRFADDATPARPRHDDDPAVLTAMVKAEAARVGLSTVGIAPYDPNYTFAEWAGTHDTASVIVCVLEQNWEATQTSPSKRSERAAMTSYAEVMELACELGACLHQRGYRARVHHSDGEAVVIHYGVAAGLGQLGLNGQLLTPQAGSRCRITLITTNAPLVADDPVDYGIHAICDACKVCIRRCPSGAIPAARRPSRGVTKAKIKTERCAPIVAQADGCAVCMKVCPVQRYGLDAVKQRFLETGEILGKGTHELEGYRWPLDGREYGPGSKPRISSDSTLQPPGWRWP